MTGDNDKVLLKIRETIDSRRCWLADSTTPNVIYWWSPWLNQRFLPKHSGSFWIIKKCKDIGDFSAFRLLWMQWYFSPIMIWFLKLEQTKAEIWKSIKIGKNIKILAFKEPDSANIFFHLYGSKQRTIQNLQKVTEKITHSMMIDDFDNSAKKNICCPRLFEKF